MSTGPTLLCFLLFLFPILINAITGFDFNKCKIINSLNQHMSRAVAKHFDTQTGCQFSVSFLSFQIRLCEGQTGFSGRAYKNFMADLTDNRSFK